MASWDEMSALKPVLFSLRLVLLQFLQSQPKQFCAHVTKNIKPADSYSIVCNGKYGWSEKSVSVQIPWHPTRQALLSLLHCKQDGAQHVPFSEVK